MLLKLKEDHRIMARRGAYVLTEQWRSSVRSFGIFLMDRVHWFIDALQCGSWRHLDHRCCALPRCISEDWMCAVSAIRNFSKLENRHTFSLHPQYFSSKQISKQIFTQYHAFQDSLHRCLPFQCCQWRIPPAFEHGVATKRCYRSWYRAHVQLHRCDWWKHHLHFGYFQDQS